MEQRDESVPSAGCREPAAPKSMGLGLGWRGINPSLVRKLPASLWNAAPSANPPKAPDGISLAQPWNPQRDPAAALGVLDMPRLQLQRPQLLSFPPSGSPCAVPDGIMHGNP